MVMDRAYEGDATRQLASGLGYSVVVPPRKSRKVAWEYDEELYKRRNDAVNAYLRELESTTGAVACRMGLVRSRTYRPQVSSD